jgi:hypothetical protein
VNNSLASVDDVSAIDGDMVLIKTLTASSSANLSFVHGTSDVVLDSTYPIYLFKWINIHPATDNVHLQVNFRDGGSSYDATKTTTIFEAFAYEDGTSGTGLRYDANTQDLAQSTSAHTIQNFIDNDNDSSASGELWLFNPSSTTYVKHFISTSSGVWNGAANNNMFTAGYCNVTAAIDGVQFAMSSGNMDAGKIKLYGIKDS